MQILQKSHNTKILIESTVGSLFWDKRLFQFRKSYLCLSCSAFYVFVMFCVSVYFLVLLCPRLISSVLFGLVISSTPFTCTHFSSAEPCHQSLSPQYSVSQLFIVICQIVTVTHVVSQVFHRSCTFFFMFLYSSQVKFVLRVLLISFAVWISGFAAPFVTVFFYFYFFIF